jgi:hypothetical protein
LLVVETEFDAARAAFTEILATSYEGVVRKETGIPETKTLSVAGTQLRFVYYVIAVTGWTDHAAGATGQATFSQLFPNPTLVFQLEDLGKITDLNVQPVLLTFSI